MTTAPNLVSVIVPSYRGGTTLRRCVDALLAQDVSEPFDVLVVRSGLGDGATADDGRLPDDPRLHVIDRADRLDAASARNLGPKAVRAGPARWADLARR